MDLILDWDSLLIQMILIDAKEEIEAILRGIIGGLKACSLTKQTAKKINAIFPQLLEQLLQGSTQCRDKRENSDCKETAKKILLTLAIPWVLGPIKFVVVMAV